MLSQAYQVRDGFIGEKTFRTVLVLDVVTAGKSDPFGKVLELIRQRALLHDPALGDGHFAEGKVGAGNDVGVF